MMNCIVVNIISEASVGKLDTTSCQDKLEQVIGYQQTLLIKLDICYELGQEASIAPLKQVKYGHTFNFFVTSLMAVFREDYNLGTNPTGAGYETLWKN